MIVGSKADTLYMTKERIRRQVTYEKAKLAYKEMMNVYPLDLKNLAGEIWAWIKDYEGLYMESNFGRTKSFYGGKVKILKPNLNMHGYLVVCLFKDGKCKRRIVHSLVAETFIPNPDSLPEVNHISGIKFDCSVSNLEWVTTAANHQHARKNGLIKTGADSSRAKFTAEQILEIRDTCILGDKEYGIRPLAKKYGVGRSTIKRILQGKTYKNVEQDVDNSGEKS